MEKKSPRPVKIETVGKSHSVVYLDRKPGGRYHAASFYAPDHSLESVIKWIEQNPAIYLRTPQAP